jgi:hypothetical protein
MILAKKNERLGTLIGRKGNSQHLISRTFTRMVASLGIEKILPK